VGAHPACNRMDALERSGRSVGGQRQGTQPEQACVPVQTSVQLGVQSLVAPPAAFLSSGWSSTHKVSAWRSNFFNFLRVFNADPSSAGLAARTAVCAGGADRGVDRP